MAKNLHVRNGKDGYEYTEVIGDGNNGETILIPPGKDNITCTIIAGANSGKFQFTTSSDSAVLAGTATWIDWSKGEVTGTAYDALNWPITALRGVSTSGAITIEIVR